MTIKATIKLLLINGSDNDSEHVISLFRAAGRVARGQRAKSAEDLHQLLEQHNWDLLIANDQHPEIAVDQCLQQLAKMAVDIPAIVLRDQGAETALAAGACDVVASDDDHRLITASLRELGHLEQRRRYALIEEKLANAERRSAQLLAQSQDAIAYISDGMIINCNTLFSTRFGFTDTEELDCLPVIDLIDETDRDKIKTLIKVQSRSDSDSESSVPFAGLNHSGERFMSSMILGNAVYDEEKCIQMCIREPREVSYDRRSSDQRGPEVPGMITDREFREQLYTLHKQAADGTLIGSLLFISIDRFGQLRSRLGIHQSREVVRNVAQLIADYSEQKNSLARVCDDGLALLLPTIGEQKATAFAQGLCRDVEEHIIEVDGQSIQCTVSIGLLALDNQYPMASENLINRAFSGAETVRREANSDGIGNGVSVFVPHYQQQPLGDSKSDDELDAILEHAIDHNRFSLEFQPVVSLRGTSGDHYEVQTRMLNEQDQQVAAAEFLSSIKFSTTNTRFDRWVILEASKQLSAKIELDPDTRLFINLTSHALQDKSLISWLGVALKAGDIPPQSIIFQFDERVIIDYLKPAIAFTQAIRALGCKLSIDGFGQSEDPLKTLKNIDADFAKISGRYTRELDNDSASPILKAMVSSIFEHQSQAIVSDVENAAALAMLWQMGVDYIQGGYLAVAANRMSYEFTDIA